MFGLIRSMHHQSLNAWVSRGPPLRPRTQLTNSKDECFSLSGCRTFQVGAWDAPIPDTGWSWPALDLEPTKCISCRFTLNRYSRTGIPWSLRLKARVTVSPDSTSGLGMCAAISLEKQKTLSYSSDTFAFNAGSNRTSGMANLKSTIQGFARGWNPRISMAPPIAWSRWPWSPRVTVAFSLKLYRWRCASEPKCHHNSMPRKCEHHHLHPSWRKSKDQLSVSSAARPWPQGL